MIEASTLALGLGASGTLGWAIAIVQTHRLTKKRVELAKEQEWHKGTQRLLQDAYQIEPEAPQPHELHSTARMKRAVRAGLQELRRIAALDRPRTEPMDDVMRDAIAIGVDGHVNMIGLTNAIVSAWLGDEAPKAENPSIVNVPLMTLDAIAAQHKVEKFLGLEFVENPAVPDGLLMISPAGYQAIKQQRDRDGVNLVDPSIDQIHDAYTMSGRRGRRAENGE